MDWSQSEIRTSPVAEKRSPRNLNARGLQYATFRIRFWAKSVFPREDKTDIIWFSDPAAQLNVRASVSIRKIKLSVSFSWFRYLIKCSQWLRGVPIWKRLICNIFSVNVTMCSQSLCVTLTNKEFDLTDIYIATKSKIKGVLKTVDPQIQWRGINSWRN